MCITEVLLQIWESDCIFVQLLKCLYKCGKALTAIWQDHIPADL